MSEYRYLPSETEDDDPPTDGSVVVFGVVDTSDDDMTYQPVTMDEEAAAIVAKYGVETMRFISALHAAMLAAGLPVLRPVAAAVDDRTIEPMPDWRRQRARYPKSVMG